MIDRGDIRQAIDRCSNIWASLPGAGYGQFEHKADSLIAKFKEAGGTVREIDVWAESPRLSPLWLSASSSACHGLLIITVITPATYKAQRDKNARELKLANAAITDMQMRQRDVKVPDAKYTKELADAKAENDALRDDAPLRRRLHISSLSVAWSHHRPAWIMQPPPDWQTPLNGIISPSERLITMQKQLEGTQKYINEQQIELPISMGNSCNYCEQYTMRFQRSINA